MATPDYDLSSSVLHEDNHLLVVNKPAGLLAQEDETGDPDVLTLGKAYLKAKYGKPGRVFLGLVHRLDRPTSGVMVLARTSKAASRLSAQFRERSIEKRYLAMVAGDIESEGRRADYLSKQNRKVSIVLSDAPGAMKAILRWKKIGERGPNSLIEVDLETGRPHQIRVQMSAQGHPILGDLRYGSKGRWTHPGIALHAAQLGIKHPTRDERLQFQSAPIWR